MDYQELNAQQREAVTHTEGPLLTIAGPGSGKTRVITYRIAHIIKTGLAPASAVLAVTFTNKAAGEMRKRSLSLLAQEGPSPIVTTFHSFCARILRQDGGPLAQIRPGFTRKFRIFDTSDQIMVIKDCYEQLSFKQSWFLPHKDVLGRISRAKTRGQTPADLLQEAMNNPQRQNVARVYEKYEELMRREDALDFDDLLGETVRLLRHDDHVRRALNQRFEYIMVDEFQDTNGTQYELIGLLTQRRQNICVVGDDDQGIYSWRGATVENIAHFKRDYRNVKVIHLDQNYRSTQTIVAGSSEVVGHNKLRVQKELWTEAAPGQPIGFCEAYDADAEAQYIAECIRRYQSDVPNSHAAVLYRSSSQSRSIETAMQQGGLKYKVVGGTSFFERAEVKDVMAYLKLANGYRDRASLLRVINRPPRGIGKAAIKEIKDFAQSKNLDLWGAIEQMNGRAIVVFRRVVADLSAAAVSCSLPDSIRHILKRTGYQQMLENESAKNPEDGRARLDNVRELIDAAAAAEQRGETAAEFIDYMALASDADEYDESALVSLMTLHAAKGLEFPLVFICGLEDGRLPNSYALAAVDREALEEERRVFYVGMTRAKSMLILTCARFRMKYGNGPPKRAANLRSRFLKEVPQDLLIDLGAPSLVTAE